MRTGCIECKEVLHTVTKGLHHENADRVNGDWKTQANTYCVANVGLGINIAGRDAPMHKWTIEERMDAQNRNFRHDRLCMSIVRPVIQATRESPPKELPTQWIGHSCIGNVYFKTIDAARKFAEELGYEGIYL